MLGSEGCRPISAPGRRQAFGELDLQDISLV